MEAGREGKPHLMALAYFSLGDRAEEDLRDNLMHYYAWLGDEVAGMIADGAAKDADAVKQYLAAYEEAGCDELVFCPSSSDPGRSTCSPTPPASEPRVEQADLAQDRDRVGVDVLALDQAILEGDRVDSVPADRAARSAAPRGRRAA